MSGASYRHVRLCGAHVELRGLEESDLPWTMNWRNDERSMRWFKSNAPLEWDSHLAWFKRYELSGSNDCMFFAVTLDGRPVGQSSIYNFSEDGRRAEVGRFLSDPDLRGKGLFREALLLTLDVAFDHMRLSEVFLEVLAANERAIRLYESVGFKRTNDDVGSGLVHMTLSDLERQSLKRPVVNEEVQR